MMPESQLKHNGATLHFEGGVYIWKRKRAPLTRTEVQVLALLMRNAGKVVTYEKINMLVFPKCKGNICNVYINYLRNNGVSCITTVRGKGYKYCGTCEECKR